jgi:cytochrome c556
MNRRARVTAAGLALALGVWFVTASGGRTADDDEDKQAIKDAQQALTKLMDTMAKGGNTAAEVKAIRDKFGELKPIMYAAFKPRKNGGMGIGPPGQGDGIELKIISLGKRALQKPDVAKWQDDLQKIADVSKAIAEVADLYPPKKDAEKWKQYDTEMRKGAEELARAAKGGDPKAIKNAANNLNASCSNCHSDFRD